MTDKLTDLRKRYAPFGEALSKAHAHGKINSENVRFFIEEGRPQILGEDGKYHDDPDAEPFYYGRAQAYDYVGDPPSGTIATQIDVSLVLDRSSYGMVLGVLCKDLNAHLARLRETP